MHSLFNVRRFGVAQLLMALAVIAILTTLIQSDGCGRRLEMVESLSFCTNDTRLVVAVLNARLKHGSKSDVARTVSIVDASSGVNLDLIRQDFKSKRFDHSLPRHVLRLGSVLCNPSSDHVVVGGDRLTYQVEAQQPTEFHLTHSAYVIAFSKSGRYLAAGDGVSVTVLDTTNGKTLWRGEGSKIRGQFTMLSFSNDDSRIILVGRYDLEAWDLFDSSQNSSVIPFKERINSISVIANDHVVVCTDDWVRRFDAKGQLVAAISDRGARFCSSDRVGSRLATAGADSLSMYDLNSNLILHSIQVYTAPSSLAMSSNGVAVAVGDNDGHVENYDVITGTRQWRATPIGQIRRAPWPWAAALLIACYYFARYMSRRGGIASRNGSG